MGWPRHPGTPITAGIKITSGADQRRQQAQKKVKTNACVCQISKSKLIIAKRQLFRISCLGRNMCTSISFFAFSFEIAL
jgi:hypothetical protein